MTISTLLINRLVDTVTSHNKYFLSKRIITMLPLDLRVFTSFDFVFGFFFPFLFYFGLKTLLGVSLQMQTDVSHLMTQ